MHDGFWIQVGWEKGDSGEGKRRKAEKQRKEDEPRTNQVQVSSELTWESAIVRAGAFNAEGRGRGPRRRHKKNSDRRTTHFGRPSIEGAKHRAGRGARHTHGRKARGEGGKERRGGTLLSSTLCQNCPNNHPTLAMSLSVVPRSPAPEPSHPDHNHPTITLYQ